MHNGGQKKKCCSTPSTAFRSRSDAALGGLALMVEWCMLAIASLLYNAKAEKNRHHRSTKCKLWNWCRFLCARGHIGCIADSISPSVNAGCRSLNHTDTYIYIYICICYIVPVQNPVPVQQPTDAMPWGAPRQMPNGEHWILNRNYVAYAYVWVPYLPLIQIHMYIYICICYIVPVQNPVPVQSSNQPTQCHEARRGKCQMGGTGFWTF